MRELHPCVACDTTEPLEAMRTETGGAIVAFCPTCGQQSRVDERGRVIWKHKDHDVSGTVIDGP